MYCLFVCSRKGSRVCIVFYAILLHLLTFFKIMHELRYHGQHDPDGIHFDNTLPPLNKE